MKSAYIAVGAILIVLGAALILQGVGVVRGTFMTGHVQWTGWGAFALAFGAGFIVWANRTPKV